MKKVFVTTCAVVFAAVAASAQGLGTVRDINSFGTEYMPAQSKSTRQQTIKKEQKKVGNLEKAIAQANIKHYRQMFVLGSLGDAAQFAQYAPCTTPAPAAQKTAAKKTSSQKPAATKQAEKQAPAYYPYAGREGKVMALGDAFAARMKARKEARKQEKAQAAKEAKKEPAAKKEKGSWLGALFGGRYPGESDEDYAYRLQMSTHPACQPFK